MEWQPIETVPKTGEFLIAVWEGNWNEPRNRWRVYHATGYPEGPSWAMRGHYRTEEGGVVFISWLDAITGGPHRSLGG